MAISRARKEDLVEVYAQQLERSQGAILAHYSSLSVAQMQDLRRRAREQDSEVFVIKNTLLERVLQEHSLTPPVDLFSGPTLVAFCYKDAPPVAKLFRDYAKENDTRFMVRGALVEGHFYGAADVATLADMPPREVMFAKLLGTINAPATQTVGVVASGIRQVMNVLQAYVDKLEGGNQTAEAAA